MVKDRETDVSRTTKRVALVLELLQRHTEQGNYDVLYKINISAIIRLCVQTALSVVKDRETDVSRTTKRVALVLELLQRHTEQGMAFHILDQFQIHTWSTLYYIRPLLNDIVSVSVRFNHSFSTKRIVYIWTIGTITQLNQMGTNTHCIATITFCKETLKNHWQYHWVTA